MSRSDIAHGTSADFGFEQFIDNAKIYQASQKIVDAAAEYDNVDDAIAALRAGWTLRNLAPKRVGVVSRCLLSVPSLM